jgi:hypothetical protein
VLHVDRTIFALCEPVALRRLNLGMLARISNEPEITRDRWGKQIHFRAEASEDSFLVFGSYDDQT